MVFNWSRAEISLYLLILFYFFAGLNHFIMPGFYIPLIPYDHPNPKILNIVTGIVEISFAVGLLFKRARKYAVYGIIALLVIFIPVHVIFIREGNCFEGYFCIPGWLGQLRLWVIHPILIYWAWSQKNNKLKIL